MKRYIVVAWDNHYPLGGLRNVQASFHKYENAQAVAAMLMERQLFDNSEVFDIKTFVAEYECSAEVDEVLTELGLDNDEDA